jgi:large subunit ribosomal protein L29
MPIMRIKEINDLSSEQRTRKLSELRAELSRLRTMVSAGGAVENPARIKELRRTIAKVLTVEREQQLGIRKQEEKQAEKTKKKKEKKKK